MPSAETLGAAAHAASLFAVARASLALGVRERRPLEPVPREFPPALREVGASFVTLRSHAQLRGCSGSLEAVSPLVVDVARSAFAAGFRDPRFPPLETDELDGLALHLSLLGSLEPLSARSEPELLEVLRPGVDGLVLREGERRATFLPAVWESLPEPLEFLSELRRKAGLAPDHWSPGLRFLRYRVEELEEGRSGDVG